ncbi:MAG: CBM20 domain-containing protein, partial [Chthoniobacterales bacterium]
MSRIRFHIVPPIGNPEEKIYLCGNLPEMGAWDAARALPLEYKAPFHDVEIEIPDGGYVEYKIIRGSWETEAVDAFGDVLPNFRHEAWFNHTIRHVVADWKDRFRGRLTA